MARDDEQQAMTSERLAELEQMAFAFGDWQPTRALINGIHELLAEVERLRAREAALLAVVRVIANMEHRVGWADAWTPSLYDALVEQARALLASADAAEAGSSQEQAAQGEA